MDRRSKASWSWDTTKTNPEKQKAWIPRIREMVGTYAWLLKGNMGACCWGLRKLTEAFLHQKLIEQTQERTFHTRHDSFFTLSPITVPIYPFPPSSFSFPSPVTPITHAHTHTHLHTSAAIGFLHVRGCWSLLFIQTSLENKVKMSRCRTKLTVLMIPSPSSWGQECVFHFFFIPLTAPITRYHMLCTYLALNKCLLNGWLFPSPPPFPSHPYSITLKICCRAVGRGLRSVLTNNPYGCLKPKDRIFKAEIWAATSWVFFEEMHKAVQIDSLSDRT